MSAQWAGRFIGIPYLAGGDTAEGADCYGLVRLVYRQILGRETPLLPSDVKTEGGAGVCPAKWTSVPDGCTGDVVVFRFNGLPSHCGIVVGRGQMLHAVRGQRSAIENYDSMKWLKRFAGYYRLEENR